MGEEIFKEFRMIISLSFAKAIARKHTGQCRHICTTFGLMFKKKRNVRPVLQQWPYSPPDIRFFQAPNTAVVELVPDN